MSVVELTDSQLRKYYRETLSGDGVCTLTEDEFVEEYKYYKSQGEQLALDEFTGMPTTVKCERSSMIHEAQKQGQKTYQTVVVWQHD